MSEDAHEKSRSICREPRRTEDTLERAALGNEEAPTFKEAVVRRAQEVLSGAVAPSAAKRYLSSIAQRDGTLRRDRSRRPRLRPMYRAAKGRRPTRRSAVT